MSSVIYAIHPNPPLSSLAPFRYYGSAKQTSLFCSRLNRITIFSESSDTWLYKEIKSKHGFAPQMCAKPCVNFVST